MHALRLFSPRTHGSHNSMTFTRPQSDTRSRHRPLRRITGYHNAFDETHTPLHEGAPLDYPDPQSPIMFAPRSQSDDRPPPYSCTASIEGTVEMRFERTSPFDSIKDAQWDTVFVRLQGTMLEVRQAKTHGLFTPASVRGTVTGEPGKLLKSFSLQHAEVGVAADYRKVEMVPKSPIAQLLAASALEDLQHTDPQQFDIAYNYVSRLRLEGNQFLLRFKTSEERSEWMTQLCAGVDISPPLDVRSEPRYHTLPRRRRRDHHEHHEPSLQGPGDEPSTLVEEQESIMRSHYPNLLTPDSGREPHSTTRGESRATLNGTGNNHQASEEPDPEGEDLDLAFMAAGQTDGAVGVDDYDTTDAVLGGAGRTRAARKWRPSIHIDPSREARYRRRCMPVLVYNSRYADDIIYFNGKRMTIDWKSRRLQPFPIPLPAYSSRVTNDDGTTSSTAITALRQLLRQPSAPDLAPSSDRTGPRPSMATAASSADVTDGSGDEQSQSSRVTSWKGAAAWGRRIKHLRKSKEHTRTTPRSGGTSMSVNKVRSTDSDNWQLKSIPSPGRLLSASLLEDSELRHIRC